MRGLIRETLEGVAIGLAMLLVVRGADVVLLSPPRPPLVARAFTLPAAYRLPAGQVPTPGTPHKHREDGKDCQPTGADACHCKLRYCTYREPGQYVDTYDMNADCQWYCEKDHCTCHPCPSPKDCPQGAT